MDDAPIRVARPIPGDQHLFELPPPIPKPPPPPMIVRGSLKFNIDFEADVAALVAAHREEYDAVDMSGWEEWERPSVFLWAFLSEMVDTTLGGYPHVKETWADEPEIRFRMADTHKEWGKAETEQLALAVDINCPCCGETQNPDPATCSFCVDQGHDHT